MSFSMLECPTCLCEYSPTLLPIIFVCGHAMCVECFDMWKTRDPFRCPVDQSTSSTKGLSPAYNLMPLIEQLQELRGQLSCEESKITNIDESFKEQLKNDIQEIIEIYRKKFYLICATIIQNH